MDYSSDYNDLPLSAFDNVYNTPEKLQKRGEELDNENIAALTRSARKHGKGSVPFTILQDKYGLDGDYSAYDYGGEKEKV